MRLNDDHVGLVGPLPAAQFGDEVAWSSPASVVVLAATQPGRRRRHRRPARRIHSRNRASLGTRVQTATRLFRRTAIANSLVTSIRPESGLAQLGSRWTSLVHAYSASK